MICDTPSLNHKQEVRSRRARVNHSRTQSLNHVFATPPPNRPRYVPPNPTHLPPSKTPLTRSPRQTHRPPHPRRTQSLLRQRTHLPLLAKLHRNPGRSRNRPPQFRRPSRPDFRRTIHSCGYGDDDLCVVHLSLEG